MAGRIQVVFRKEVVDNLRDRRSVGSALIMPLFMPIFLVSLIMVVGRSILADPVDRPLPIAVQGAQNAPGLVAYLEQHGATILPAPSDAQAQVVQGNLDMVLVIPADYAASFRGGHPADLQIILDSSRQSARTNVSRVRSLLGAYSQQVGALRLLARGVDPNVVSALAVESLDVATPQSQTLIFLNMLPFLIVVVIFTGGMYVIIDTTAGERERGSLEPLLINPATREEFILGKLFAALPFACGTLLLSLLAFWAAFKFIPLEQYTGFPLAISAATLWSIFWISLPLVLLASGLQIVIATFTRSFKEAQTYLALLPLVAGLPGAFLAFLPIKASLLTMIIPAFSQSLLINQVMRGEAVQPVYVLLSTLVTLGLSLLLILLAIRLYQSERIVMGG
jgi:sodium transport system permease protein